MVTGALAKIDDSTIFATVIGSKFLQLLLSAFVFRKVVLEEGQSLESYLRKEYGSSRAKGGAEKKEE